MKFSDFYHQTLYSIQKLFGIALHPERERLVAMQHLRPLKILSSGSILDEQEMKPTRPIRSIDTMKVREALDGFSVSESLLKEYFGEETLAALHNLKLVSLIEIEMTSVNKAIANKTQALYLLYNAGTVWGYRMSAGLITISLLLGGVGHLIFANPIAEATKMSDQLWLDTYDTCMLPLHCSSPYQIVERFSDCIYGVPSSESDCEEFISSESIERFACAFLNLTYSCSLMLCNAQRDACRNQDFVESPYHYMLAFGIACLVMGIIIASVSRCGLNKSQSKCRIEVLDNDYTALARSPAFIDSLQQGEAVTSTKNVIQLLKNRKAELTERYESKIPFVPDTRCQLFSRSRVNRLLDASCMLFKNATQIEEISDDKDDIYPSMPRSYSS